MLLTSSYLPDIQPAKSPCRPTSTAVMITKLDKEVQTVSLRCLKRSLLEIPNLDYLLEAETNGTPKASRRKIISCSSHLPDKDRHLQVSDGEAADLGTVVEIPVSSNVC